MQGHNSLQVLRQVGTPGRLASGEGGVLDGVSVGDVVHKRQTVATEGLSVRADATHADACRLMCKDNNHWRCKTRTEHAILTSKAHAMVATLSADKPHLAAITICTVVLQGNLQGSVHRSGAAHREEDVVEVSAR